MTSVEQDQKSFRQGPPPLSRNRDGAVDTASLANVIQWFLDYDERVAIIRHPNVEEIFQWKQKESELAGESVYLFKCAEDRLAIGILQALMANSTELMLFTWIS